MRVVLVPAVPALLPAHAGLTDPVAELRQACTAAITWLLQAGPARVAVVGEPSHSLGLRVARSLLQRGGHRGVVEESPASADALVIVANGTARRSEKAPGHLDHRAFAFDQALGDALKTGDLDALAGLDPVLGEDLLAAGLDELRQVAGSFGSWRTVEMLYDDDPFGVQYWVVNAQCES